MAEPQTPKAPKKPKLIDPNSPTLDGVTALAAYLNRSRGHVSANYQKWGFRRTPTSTDAAPMFLKSDADLHIAGKLLAVRAGKPVAPGYEGMNIHEWNENERVLLEIKEGLHDPK